MLDASVAVAWCFEDETTELTEKALSLLEGTYALVPPIWSLEVANVLLFAERRGRLTQAQTARFLSLLHALPLTLFEGLLEPEGLIALGREHDLSSYDASYLAVALMQGLPLATQDGKLQAAARRAGVPLLG